MSGLTIMIQLDLPRIDIIAKCFEYRKDYLIEKNNYIIGYNVDINYQV